jgi:hypothetical protein
MMISKIKAVSESAISPLKRAYRLGFWSAILTAVFAAVAFAVGITTPARSGPFCSSSCISYPFTNVAAFIPVDYVWLYPGILLSVIFVVLMACIHSYASNDRKVFSQIGLSFALAYAVVIAADYFVQFTVVIPSLSSGETAGLSLFTQYNPHGIFIALEGIGYLMMSVAFLTNAVVFSKGKLEHAIRWIFLIDFILAAGFLAGLSWLKYDIVAFEVAILTINWMALIVSGILLGILFKRAERFSSYRLSDAATAGSNS